MDTIDIWENVKTGHIPKPPLDDWTLYYDETGNCGSFKIDASDDKKYNCTYGVAHDFILGGLALRPDQKPDTKRLIDNLHNIKNNQELKTKNFVKDRIPFEFGSRNALTFLKWILDEDILIHYYSMNNIYMSYVIDLVDEACEHANSLMKIHDEMKDQFFQITYRNLSEFTEILTKYRYPAIDEKQIPDFFKRLADFISDHMGDNVNPPLMFLKSGFTKAYLDGTILDLDNKNEGELIKDYSEAYWWSMQNAPNAYHIFDNECRVKSILKKLNLTDGIKPYERYTFKDSKNDIFIQLSDVFIGILSKCFTFLDSITEAKESKINSYIPSKTEKEFFIMMNEIINKTEHFCFTMICSTCDQTHRERRFRTLEYLAKHDF